MIDKDYVLVRLEVQKDITLKTISEVSLKTFGNIEEHIEKEIKDKEFIRICVSDRCLTIKGVTMNYLTGVEWGKQSNFTESVPFTNIQISIPKN